MDAGAGEKLTKAVRVQQKYFFIASGFLMHDR